MNGCTHPVCRTSIVDLGMFWLSVVCGGHCRGLTTSHQSEDCQNSGENHPIGHGVELPQILHITPLHRSRAGDIRLSLHLKSFESLSQCMSVMTWSVFVLWDSSSLLRGDCSYHKSPCERIV